MIRRFLAVIALTLVVVFAPGVLVDQPSPAERRVPGVIPIPTVAPVGPPSGAIAGPTDQPGLFASDPILLRRSPAGPFARGGDGMLDVIGIIPDPAGQAVLVALRNSTDTTIEGVQVSATIFSGAIPMTATTDVIAPAQVVPGGLAFATISLGVPVGYLSSQRLPSVSVIARPPTLAALPGAPATPLLGITSATLATDLGALTLVVEQGGGSEPAAALDLVTVCFTRIGTDAYAVSSWSRATLDLSAPTAGTGGTTLTATPPPGCGALFIATVVAI